jgi:UDP-N-acetylmuramoyl-L-alanyl-D-glutamate--2,6-diaminopimelate ligase
MRFSELVNIAKPEIGTLNVQNDFAINKLCYRSDIVQLDDVFFAIKGLKFDGNNFISDAIRRGAKAIISDYLPKDISIPIYNVRDCRKALAIMSNIYFGFPSLKLKMVGVTGTNGKTTVTNIINHTLVRDGKRTGLIGTNGNFINNVKFETSFTTPESVELNELLNKMVQENVEYVTMEVSSHSLELKRVYSIEFDTVVFTNLTHDHLDFHVTMENYFNSKKILFDTIPGVNKKGTKTYSIYNSDDKYGEKIIADNKSDKISYGLENSVYSVKNLSMTFSKMNFDIISSTSSTDNIHIESSLIGKFNVYNILAAVAVLKTQDISDNTIIEGISTFIPVDGRFNQIKLNNGAIAIIDYSHTPDSLSKALTTIREIQASNKSEGKLITVFGCGGDRDKSKRPVMGVTASELSDYVIITSDNPRSENPFDIINDIISGITKNNSYIVSNREEAIKQALAMSKADDIILIAGKGHETYQEINNVKHHFSDREVVEKFI